MPLFRKPVEPAQRAALTVNGHTQHTPEGPGTVQRRYRLFVECERRLADDPLASPNAFGQPLGDGQGLEGLVEKIAPLFASEPSILRWVALRGALSDICIRVLDPESAVAPPDALERAMGIEWVQGPDAQSHPDLAEPWRTKLTAEQREAALGIASVVLTRASDYPRYSEMSVDDVNADERSGSLTRVVALDVIAWSAVALLRLEIAQQLFPQVPEPDALVEPGWYTEPLFAKAERYWDGADWTRACRVADGRQYREATVALS